MAHNYYKYWFAIETGKDMLKNPLFGNRYIVSFVGEGSKVKDTFPSGLGFLVNTMSLPTVNYNPKLQYIGGINVVIPTILEQGQLDFTMYNTGREYSTIKNWCDTIYNPKTRAYSYINDVLASIKVMEFYKSANMIVTHTFSGCSLYQFGGLQLTYEESTAIETFQVSVHYRSYSVELNK